MTDDKKVQPMTLDEFDKRLANEENTLLNIPDDEYNEQYDSGFKDGLGRARSILRLHRPALEAEMRGTLRFRIVKMGDELTDAIWYQTHMLGSDPRMTVLIFGNVPTRQMAKIFAATLANNISKTAEFVDGESDE